MHNYLTKTIMKQPFLFLAFFLYLLHATGQNSFSFIYGEGDTSKRPYCIKQIDDCFYLLSCDFDLPSFSGYKAEVLKINSNGDLLNTRNFFTDGIVSGPLRKIHPLNDSEFLVFGGYREDETSNTSIWVIKMDTALNVIWEKFYPTNVQHLEKIRFTINHSDNIVLIVTLAAGGSNVEKVFLFLEISLSGDLIRSKYDATGSPILTNGYSIISHNNGYYAFVMGYASYMPMPITSPAQRLDLDLDFNITKVHTLPNGINFYMTALKADERTYYLVGDEYFKGFHTEIGIQKTDTSNTVLYSNHAGLPGDVPDGPSWQECLTIKFENSVFTGGVGPDPGVFYQCHLSHPNVFILSNYDSLLNNRWTKYYGSDTACYYMMDLDATSDGGCIMTGTILSPNSNPNKTDIIVIKVDSEGLITSTNKSGATVKQALVYPNPGSDYLMLQTGQQNMGVVFTLTNLSGQKLIEQTINSTTQQIHSAELAAGIYVWTLSRGNSIVETGKWIKQ